MIQFLIYFLIYCSIFNLFLDKHILSILLTLEFIIVSLFILIIKRKYFITAIIFLCLGACEGVLGLSLIINLSNIHNNSYLNRQNILKC